MNELISGKKKGKTGKAGKAGNAREPALTRTVLGRLARITELLKQGKYPNCSTLAKELEVSTKTVQRDLDTLRYNLNAEIEFDVHHNGFYLTKPLEGIPFVSMTSQELFAVCVVQKAIEHYRKGVLEIMPF